MKQTQHVLHRIVNDIDESLPRTPVIRPGGSLLIMVGLPGTGKSSVVEGLQARIACTVISTDGIRLQMRQQPTYTAAEMMLVYEVCYSIIESRLQDGQRVVFDASNYLAARREHVSRIARRTGAPVAVCYVQASQAAIRERLRRRVQGQRRESDLSDADWSVYKWMVEAQEPVVGEHLILDSTSTSPDVLAENLYNYWLECEANAPINADMAPPRWSQKFDKPNPATG